MNRGRSRTGAGGDRRSRDSRRAGGTSGGPTFPCPRCGRPLRRATRRTPPRITCPRCRFLIFDYPRPCAGVVVVKGDRALMLRRGHSPRRGCLDIPGGFIDAGESIAGAARRELREETGLSVGRVEWLGLWWDRYYLKGFGWFPTMSFYFMARWRAGEPRAADDAASAEWIPIPKLGRTGARLAWKHMPAVFAELRRRMRGRRGGAVRRRSSVLEPRGAR